MNTYTIYKVDGSSSKLQAEHLVWEQNGIVFYNKGQEVARFGTAEISAAYQKDFSGVACRIKR